MKPIEQQIRETIEAIEKQEGNLQVLQAKLSRLVRQTLADKSTTNESTKSANQLLQE